MHQPIIPDVVVTKPKDTTIIITPPPPPPNPKDSVCFIEEILPILQSNCAMSGCHDPVTANGDVKLNSYYNVLSTVSGSKLINSITNTDPNDRMPRSPLPPLSQAQIDLIKKWVSEGMKNDIDCGKGCDTTNVTFAKSISPIITNYCQGCHNNSNLSGGINLQGYTNIITHVNSGRLIGTIEQKSGFSPMPKGGTKLSDCNIKKIQIWVAAGAPNN